GIRGITASSAGCSGIDLGPRCRARSSHEISRRVTAEVFARSGFRLAQSGHLITVRSSQRPMVIKEMLKGIRSLPLHLCRSISYHTHFLLNPQITFRVAGGASLLGARVRTQCSSKDSCGETNLRHGCHSPLLASRCGVETAEKSMPHCIAHFRRHLLGVGTVLA